MEYYKLLEEKGVDEPSVGKAKAPAIKGKEYVDEKD